MTFNQKVAVLALIDSCAITEIGKDIFCLARRGQPLRCGTYEFCFQMLAQLYGPCFINRDAIMRLIEREGTPGIILFAQSLVGAKKIPGGMKPNWHYCVGCLNAPAEMLADAFIKFKGLWVGNPDADPRGVLGLLPGERFPEER